MTNGKEKPEENAEYKYERPKIFLILAGVMLLITLLSYIFENWLYDVSEGVEMFVLLLSGSLALALFFLTCYRVPRLGLKMLGREAELGLSPQSKSGLTYNIFKVDSGVQEKILATERKKNRKMRHSFKNVKVVPKATETLED